jgi:hypothetical protein
MPFSRHNLSKRTSAGRSPKRAEDLAVVGEDLLWHPVTLEGLGEEGADRPGRRPGHDARTHAETAVIIDAGQHLALGAVVEEDPADNVHLPELHGARTLPALVGAQPLALLLGLDEVVAHQGPIDGHVRGHRFDLLAPELVLETDRAPGGMALAQCDDPRFDFRIDLVRARFGLVRALVERGQPALFIALHPPIDGLAAHAVRDRCFTDRQAVSDDGQDCVITLFHFAELHEHSAHLLAL